MIDISRAMPGWTVEELIGKGSYGTVYRIKKEEMGYTYYSALKVIELPSDMKEVYNLQAMGMNEDSIKSYYEGTAKEIASEIRIMESLKSAGNVVHVEEHALIPKADGIGWTILIRMELLESIQKYQQKAGNPDYYETIKIGKDICSALQCCEEKGIIHRDIKPDNLFRNEFGMYKLGDFGIARQMQNTLAAYSQKGTIGFLAPEVYKGGYYDNTVDIYSLGVMLYVYMNRQRPPFVDLEITNLTAKTLDEAHWRRLSGELPPPPVDAPQQLADVILKACNPDPRRRYRTAAEFREALENCENGDIQPAKIFNIPSLFGKNRQRDIEAAEEQDYSPPEYPANYTNSQYVGEQGNVLAEESSGTANKGLMGVLIALIVVLFIAVSGGILYVNMPGLVQGITQVRITNLLGNDVNEVQAKYNAILKNSLVPVYTNKDYKEEEIVYQYPLAGTVIDSSEEGLSLYYSIGNLTNDVGYTMKSSFKDLTFQKGETQTITLTVQSPEARKAGTVTMIQQEGGGFSVNFHEWEGKSIDVDLTFDGSIFKGGMLQFYFLEKGEIKGCYCDVYYRIKE